MEPSVFTVCDMNRTALRPDGFLIVWLAGRIFRNGMIEIKRRSGTIYQLRVKSLGFIAPKINSVNRIRKKENLSYVIDEAKFTYF